MSSTPPDAELLRELDRLEAESAARRAELRRLSTAVPHAVSRRSVLVAMASDLRAAPDRRSVMRRLARKVLRGPAAVARRTLRLPGER